MRPGNHTLNSCFFVKLPALIILVFSVLLLLHSANVWAGSAGERQVRKSARSRLRANSQPTALTHLVQAVDFVEKVEAEPIDLQAVQLEDQQREQQGAPYRFAIPRAVKIIPETAGTWEMIDEENVLWRLRITSPGAVSLNLGFTRYHMPAGGSLFIYAADYGEVIGPFTEDDNEEHGQLWTPVIHSDDIVVELTVPVSEADQLEFELGSINHGYRGLRSLLTDKAAVDSGACNVNVACPEGDAWRDQIRSIAMYTVSGSIQCSGVLVNNTAADDKPYFLTADHCGITNGNDATMVVYWNYQASTCGGTTGPLSQTQTGATLRADYISSDFTLVELDDMPDLAFDVYYAGWNRGSAVPSSAVAIHHPSGDLKKISIENNPLSITSYGYSSSPGDGTHLRVADWDVGTTEPGSSGCPIFDQNKRVVGQLHGGYAACGNDLSDWFGRFYKSWTGGGNSSSRLSNWLDPLNTGVTFIDGKDPIPTYCDASGGCDEYISGVEVGTIGNTGTGCDNYADYTYLSTTMVIGAGYSITVTNGNGYPGDQCGIWVDWNQDFDFDDLGETISVSGSPGLGPYTAVITPPADAVLGDTRMRIRIMYTGSISPCGTITYGEVEDYRITTIASPYGGGSGTAENPYLIYEPNHMQAIGAHPSDWDKHFKLMADIDLGGFTGTAYNIIGTSDSNAFAGVFDGNSHTISNFIYSSTGTDYIGLFGCVEDAGAEIKNLGLIDPYVDVGTDEYIGSLVGWLKNGTLSGCYAKGGSVSGLECYCGGGLIGRNSGSVSNCYAATDVSGEDSIGGLTGYNSGTITHCYSTGTVSGLFNVGGLIGQSQSGTVINSFWDVNSSGLDTSAGGTGKTTAQMHTESTFTGAGWDFVGIWDICDGTNYPKLAWQVPLLGDFVCPDGVEMSDFAFFAEHWMENGCVPANGYCEGADLDSDGDVDFSDLKKLAENWLEGMGW
jgi:hypothetical protein